MSCTSTSILDFALRTDTSMPAHFDYKCETIKAAKDVRKNGEIHVEKLIIGSMGGSCTEIPIELQHLNIKEGVKVDRLLDSGATGLFMDRDFTTASGLPIEKLPQAIPVYNVNGTQNLNGSITESVTLMMRHRNHHECTQFYLANIGKSSVIIGHTWLIKHNLEIDWKTGEVKMTRCPSSCGHGQVEQLKSESKAQRSAKSEKMQHMAILEPIPVNEEKQHGGKKFWWLAEGHQYIRLVDPETGIKNTLWIERSRIPCAAALRINAASNISQCIAAKESEYKTKMMLGEAVPAHYYLKYKNVFKKEGFDELPPRRPWDHAIDLVPGAQPIKLSKVYPMSPSKQKDLDEFLRENMRSGRIRVSKSPWASGFFFVHKKDGKL